MSLLILKWGIFFLPKKLQLNLIGVRGIGGLPSVLLSLVKMAFVSGRFEYDELIPLLQESN